MSYDHHLSAAGMDAYVDLPAFDALNLARFLTTGSDLYPAGTSFAITSEPGLDRRRIYLSRNSQSRMRDWRRGEGDRRATPGEGG